MNHGVYRLLFWLPRLSGILFAFFLASQALDVFQPGAGWAQAFTALAVHLAPVAVVLFVLLLAWRWEGLGSAGFVLLGVLYAVYGWGRVQWSALAAVFLPMLVIGCLFFAAWRAKRKASTLPG